MSAQSTSLPYLPPEIWREIFYNYEPTEMVDLCYNDGAGICYDENFWREKFLNDFGENWGLRQELENKNVNITWRQLYTALAYGHRVLPVLVSGQRYNGFITVSYNETYGNVLDKLRVILAPVLGQGRNIVGIPYGGTARTIAYISGTGQDLYPAGIYPSLYFPPDEYEELRVR